MKITHISAATLLLEIGTLRLLTPPYLTPLSENISSAGLSWGEALRLKYSLTLFCKQAALNID